jgi:hypothetical protein
MSFVNKNLSTRGRQSLILTVGGVLAALLLTPALLRSKPPDTVHRTAYFGPLGLTTTSSARLNVIARDAVEIELLFLDSEGNTVADSGPVSLAPGGATHLTLAGASLAYAPGALRAQVQARVELLSTPAHSLAFASLELLDADDTVLVLYPQNPIRAVDNKDITLTLGPLDPRGTHEPGITVANLGNDGIVKATLSFISVDTTLLKQEQVTIEPGHTATLSMSGLEFSGEFIGTVSFDPSGALTVSSLQVFNVTTGITEIDIGPQEPVNPAGQVH